MNGMLPRQQQESQTDDNLSLDFSSLVSAIDGLVDDRPFAQVKIFESDCPYDADFHLRFTKAILHIICTSCNVSIILI